MSCRWVKIWQELITFHHIFYSANWIAFELCANRWEYMFWGLKFFGFVVEVQIHLIYPQVYED